MAQALFEIASILVDVTCLFLFIWAWLSAVGLVVALVLSIAPHGFTMIGALTQSVSRLRFKIAALYITSKYSKLVRSGGALKVYVESSARSQYNAAEPSFLSPFLAIRRSSCPR